MTISIELGVGLWSDITDQFIVGKAYGISTTQGIAEFFIDNVTDPNTDASIYGHPIGALSIFKSLNPIVMRAADTDQVYARAMPIAGPMSPRLCQLIVTPSVDVGMKAIDVSDYALDYTSGDIDLSAMDSYFWQDADGDGIYVDGIDFDSTQLANGPVNLVPAGASGTIGDGNVLTRIPGVWIYDTSGGEPLITVQWQRLDADIPDETGDTYTINASQGDLINGVQLVEYAINGNGGPVANQSQIVTEVISSIRKLADVSISNIANNKIDFPSRQKTIIMCMSRDGTQYDTNFWSNHYWDFWRSQSLRQRELILGSDGTTTGSTAIVEFGLNNADFATIPEDPDPYVPFARATNEYLGYMLTIDLTSDNGYRFYVNGHENIDASAIDTTQFLADTYTWRDTAINMWGRAGFDGHVAYVGVYDGFLDPAVHWDSFFFPDGTPKLTSLPVDSAIPRFVMYGTADDWIAEDWVVSNTISGLVPTLNGTVTDGQPGV